MDNKTKLQACSPKWTEKNTAPRLNKDGTAGILAPDTETQLRDAQAVFADQNSANTVVCQVDREEWNVKITAPGLNEDEATGTLAPGTGTQLGEAQDEFAD